MTKIELPKWATTVTPLSKYLAMVLFIALPFIGFYLGILAGKGDKPIIQPRPYRYTKRALSPKPTPISLELSDPTRTIKFAYYTYSIPQNSVSTAMTLTANTDPFTSTEYNGIRYRSVLPGLDPKFYDLQGNPITKLPNPYTMTVDFTGAVLNAIRPSTLAIFFSLDNKTWTKEATTIDG